jgi:C4-type Zn-finger protein
MNWLSSGKNSDKNEMSITRALVELKTLDSRINKLIQNSIFVSIKGELRTPSESSKDSVANYNKVKDLLSRRVSLKSAIVISNALTKVRICDMDLSIAEAIELKSSISNYENLLGTLKKQYATENRNVETLNDRTRNNLESISNNNKLKKDEDNTVADITSLSRDYMNLHRVELFDPLSVKTKIDELESFITLFKDQVDFVLSEKNATTLIEV